MVVRKRLDITGRALVFVTTTTHQWTPIFREGPIAHVVVDQLRQTSDHFKVSIVGYVLMPSHLHMLLGFPEIERLSQFMRSFKILSSKSAKSIMPQERVQGHMTNTGFRLWQPRFDDLIVTSEKQFKIKLEYIHNNPVKAMLVTEAGKWKYSSASDWLENKPGLLPVDRQFKWLS